MARSVGPETDELVQKVLATLSRQRTPAGPRWRRVLLVCVLFALAAAASGLAAWWVAWRLPAQWIVARWRLDFAAVPASVARQRVVHLPELGQAGLIMLVDALADERPDVRHSAADVLLNQADAWKRLPLKEATLRLDIVARRLRSVAQQLPVDQHARLEPLLLTFLRWPLDSTTVDTVSVLENLEHTLAVMAQRRLMSASSGMGFHVPEAAQNTPSTTSTDVAEPPLPADQSPAGAPPEESFSGPPLPPSLSGKGVRRSLSDDNEPEDAAVGRRLEENSGIAESWPREPAPLWLPWNPPMAAPPENRYGLVPLPTPVPQDIGQPLVPHGPRALETAPGTMPTDSSGVAQLSDKELARLLSRSTSRQALLASDELRRRGYSGRAISVLERLFDHDPRVRLEALDELARVPDLEPRPWLWSMLEDADAAVRQRAVAMLANDPSPQTRRQLHELRQRETDLQIQRTLDKLFQ